MVPDAEKTIFEVIRLLLARRDASHLEITLDSHLTQDLDLDSLELAELSAALEDDLGRDPYTEGIVPNTVGELLAFYAR
jgi:acyl carrier protein